MYKHLPSYTRPLLLANLLASVSLNSKSISLAPEKYLIYLFSNHEQTSKRWCEQRSILFPTERRAHMPHLLHNYEEQTQYALWQQPLVKTVLISLFPVIGSCDREDRSRDIMVGLQEKDLSSNSSKKVSSHKPLAFHNMKNMCFVRRLL